MYVRGRTQEQSYLEAVHCSFLLVFVGFFLRLTSIIRGPGSAMRYAHDSFPCEAPESPEGVQVAEAGALCELIEAPGSPAIIS